MKSVRERIDNSAAKSGRLGEQVCLVGVTKYVDAEMTRSLFEAGCTDLGESRPQVFWEKQDALSELDINWHMIGHLQRNKVKRTIANCKLVHSVDSHRLLSAINEAAAGLNKVVDVLIEVNVSGEEAKHGFGPGEMPATLEDISQLKNVSVRGLMCRAGLGGDKDTARREFKALREIRDQHAGSVPSNVELKELSMGMSGDFEIAIEEGATMVRIGSLLFEGA